MRYLIRGLLAVILVANGVVGLGCGKNPGKPNPDLKVPDVAAGGRGGKAPVAKDTAKKKSPSQ